MPARIHLRSAPDAKREASFSAGPSVLGITMLRCRCGYCTRMCTDINANTQTHTHTHTRTTHTRTHIHTHTHIHAQDASTRMFSECLSIQASVLVSIAYGVWRETYGVWRMSCIPQTSVSVCIACMMAYIMTCVYTHAYTSTTCLSLSLLLARSRKGSHANLPPRPPSHTRTGG